MKGIRDRYGAHPVHLLLMIACFALAGYALLRLGEQGGVKRAALFFAVALLVHDLVGWPLYTWADRILVRLTHRRRAAGGAPWVNYLRVPAVVSAVLLIVSFPLVFRLSAQQYRGVTGFSESPYLGRWLLVTASLFVLSAILCAGRAGATRLRSVQAPGRGHPAPDQLAPDQLAPDQLAPDQPAREGEPGTPTG